MLLKHSSSFSKIDLECIQIQIQILKSSLGRSWISTSQQVKVILLFKTYLYSPNCSHTEENLFLNRQVLRYLTSRFGQKQDYLPDIKEINGIWQSRHKLNHSGLHLADFLKIATLKSFSFLTSIPLSFLAQISFRKVSTQYFVFTDQELSKIFPCTFIRLQSNCE